MATPNVLVVVLPGIGGSMLAVPAGRGAASGSTIWSVRPRDLDLLRHPERLSVGEHEDLVPSA